MNPIVRNFVSIIRRFKLAMALNVLGLAMAFAAFVVIMMQISYERNFENCHPNADRIYRVDLQTEQWGGPILVRPFVYSIIHSSPFIEAGTIINPYMGISYITVEMNGQKVGYKESIMTCYPDITKMFNFQMVEGSADCLNEQIHVLIPESMARKFFGETSAIGKQINLENEYLWTKGEYKYLIVGGVYKDFPGNTQLNNVIYTAMGDDFTKDDWGSSNYYCYVMLQSGANPQDVADNFNRTFDFTQMGFLKEGKVAITLKPLKSLYYLNESQDGQIMKSGNPATATLLIGIGLLIIIIACINYTNIYTALVPIRIRSINTQKVLGSSDNWLRFSLIGEAMFVSLVSYLLGLGIVWYLRELHLLDFLKVEVDFGAHIGLLLGLGGLSLITGMIAGLYPSLYVTSFPPALVLKGSFGLSPSGRKLRVVLISVQFIISLVLIICASFVYLQNRYMRHIRLGFDKDQIAVVELNTSFLKKGQNSYVNKLKEHPGIEDVAFSSQKLGGQDGYMTWGNVTCRDKSAKVYVFPVSWNFFRTMGIKVIDGRMPTEADEKGRSLTFYGYESLQKYYEATPGDRVEVGWLQNDSTSLAFAGFTEDIQFSSARDKLDGGLFVLNYQPFLPVSYIRIQAGSDIDQIISHIRETVHEIDASYPVDVEFYDTIFDHLYKQEENLKQMITLFSSLAIIISLVGVFSLVMFEAIYRRKEIALRRVMGSSIHEILQMLSKTYIYIIMVCFIIASPVAYWAVGKWLENFAYKTPIYAWVFLVALLIVLGVTLATVVYQSWHAATSNPVKSLKDE